MDKINWMKNIKKALLVIFFSFIVKHYSDIFNPLVGKYNFRCQATCIEI